MAYFIVETMTTTIVMSLLRFVSVQTIERYVASFYRTEAHAVESKCCQERLRISDFFGRRTSYAIISFAVLDRTMNSLPR